MPELTTSTKSAARSVHFEALTFKPRFEYGHMAEIAQINGEEDGSLLGTGFARFNHARIPWTIKYDEVLIVFEGTLKVHIDKQVHELNSRDSMWLPAGTELIYESDDALVAYAIHPSNWHNG